MKKIHPTPPHITLSAHTTWKSPSVRSHRLPMCTQSQMMCLSPCLLFSFVFRSNYFEAWHVGNSTKWGGTVKSINDLPSWLWWRSGDTAMLLCGLPSRAPGNLSAKWTEAEKFVTQVTELWRAEDFSFSPSLSPWEKTNFKDQVWFHIIPGTVLCDSGGNEMENRGAQITSFNMVLFKAG